MSCFPIVNVPTKTLAKNMVCLVGASSELLDGRSVKWLLYFAVVAKYAPENKEIQNYSVEIMQNCLVIVLVLEC